MGKTARKKDLRKTHGRKSGALGFGIVIAAIMVLGIGGIIASRGGDDTQAGSVGPNIGDHQHAAFGVNICGQWKGNTPQYEAPTGIHSHGDGFIHMHPFSRAGANDNATVGLFMKQAGESISQTAIKLSDGTDLSNGDECPNLDNKPGKVRWSVNGEEQAGNPAEYVPNDLDVVALAFLPEGEDIGVPPVARGGQSPSDIPGAPQQQQPTTPATPQPETAPTTAPTPSATSPANTPTSAD